MQKYVFLAICVFVLGHFQGINSTYYAPPGCTCAKFPDHDVFKARQFAFIAKVTHINFTPHVVPTGYKSIVVSVQQLCNGTMPYRSTARLNTLDCPHSHAFSHLKVNQYYFIYGTYKTLPPNYRRSFVVDRCGPPCRPSNKYTCPTSLDQCHNCHPSGEPNVGRD